MPVPGRDTYQLAIVGGGPAGCFAAWEAARQGLDVILFERDSVIGQPLACAEGVSHVGLSTFVEVEPHCLSTTIDSIRFTLSRGKSTTQKFPSPIGYVLDRKTFDPWLADRAVMAGAEIVLDAFVERVELSEGAAMVHLDTPDGPRAVAADYVIASDGVESMVGRQAGLRTALKLTQAETALQYRISGIALESNVLEFVVGDKFAPGGYLWVFPKSDHSANVGLGLNPVHYGGSDLRRLLDVFCRERFSNYTIEFECCGNVPKYLGLQILGRENLLLAGDAARAIDSVTGAGIAKALHSGRLAVRSIVRAIEENLARQELQSLYRHAVDAEMGGELRFCQRAYPMFRKFTEKDWALLIDVLKESIQIDQTGSMADPVAFLKRALMRAPRLLTLARHIL